MNNMKKRKRLRKHLKKQGFKKINLKIGIDIALALEKKLQQGFYKYLIDKDMGVDYETHVNEVKSIAEKVVDNFHKTGVLHHG